MLIHLGFIDCLVGAFIRLSGAGAPVDETQSEHPRRKGRADIQSREDFRMNKTIASPARLSRRRLLAGAGTIAGAAITGFPFVRARAAQTLKVGTYGGYFKDSFDQHIYPDFTKETGIEIESIAEPTGEAWLVQLDTAARAGMAPADVSMMAQVSRLKGENSNLWAPLDEAKLDNAKNLLATFVGRYADNSISSIGAVSWYITLVTNTDSYPTAPSSWKRVA
jgi:putative spermidine/putrescine transport system substrate-binding protein